jgi:hypothetical protein
MPRKYTERTVNRWLGTRDIEVKYVEHFVAGTPTKPNTSLLLYITLFYTEGE